MNKLFQTSKKNPKMIITLDGPAGVGKSTLARLIAEKLGVPFLDSGAMFRSLALRLGEEALESDTAVLIQNCSQCEFSLQGCGLNTVLLCNGKPVGNEIRTEKIADLASRLGQLPVIRQYLLESQRKLGEKNDLVTEGRDMGTIVFPQASNKFFLEASPDIRAKRRWLEFQKKGLEVSLEDIEKSIIKRDEQDKNRSLAPLKPAEDACVIDTSDLNPDEVARLILERILTVQQPCEFFRPQK